MKNLMNHGFLTLFCICLSSVILLGQSYTKRLIYNNTQNVESAIPLSDGRAIISGYQEDSLFGRLEMGAYVAEIDSNLKQTWHTFFNFPTWSGTYSSHVVIGSDSSIYTMATGRYGGNFMHLVKFDKKKKRIWEKQYNDNFSNSGFAPIDMIMTKDGKLLLISVSGLIKLDTSGAIIWKRRMKTSFGIISIIETQFGDLLIGGDLGDSNERNKRIVLLKLDKDGQVKWLKTYFSENSYWLGTYFKKFIEQTDGSVLILGGHYDNPSSGLLMSVEPARGNVKFARIYRIGQGWGGAYTFFKDIQPLNSGGYLILGRSNGIGPTTGYYDFIMKFQDSSIAWIKKQIDLGSASVSGDILMPDNKNKYWLFGQTPDNLSFWGLDVSMSKLSPNGESCHFITFSGNLTTSVANILVDTVGIIYPLDTFNISIANVNYQKIVSIQNDSTICFCPYAKAAFTFTQSKDTIRFKSTDTTAISFKWDFGDFTTSTERNPIHIYTRKSNFNVCLTVSDNCSSNTFCQQINTTKLLETTNITYFKAYPNPNNGWLHVVFQANTEGVEKTLTIINLTGTIVRQLKTTATDLQLNVSDLPNTAYFFQAKRTDKPAVSVQRFVLMK